MAPRKTKKTATQNRRRKGFLAVFLPWAKRFGLWMTAIVVILWIGAWFVLSGGVDRTNSWIGQQIIAATAKAGFTVQEVLLEGRENADPLLLRALLNIEADDPLFAIAPVDAKKLLEETEWVRSAHVERRLPGTLYIRLQERKPTALWQKGKRLYLVDEDGAEIKTDRLERFADLVTISGEGAPDHIYVLLQELEKVPDLKPLIRSAEYISDRRWNIKTTDDVTLKLPEENIAQALIRAEEAQRTEGFLNAKGLDSVDLRYDDKMIIRTKPGAVREYKKNKGEGA